MNTGYQQSTGTYLNSVSKKGQTVQAGDTLAIHIGSTGYRCKNGTGTCLEAAAQAQNEKAIKGARQEQIQAAYEMWQKARAG